MKILIGMAILVKMGKDLKCIDMAAVVVRGVLCKPHALGVAASCPWSEFSLVGR